MQWEILDKNSKNVLDTLLKNRGIKTKKERDEFSNPPNPSEIQLTHLGMKAGDIKKVINRVLAAKENNEEVVIYGDYDVDGICSTAILWEALHSLGLKVYPHIPNRFEEGYGINAKSVENLKSKIPNLKLIVTVDNGIVAYEAIKTAKKMGIDVIVVDHHQKGTKKLATDLVLHSTITSGAGLSYFLAKELCEKVRPDLELAAIGVIADQIPLTGINRSIVKYGLKELSKTKRPGLLALFDEAGLVSKKAIGTYEVNYIIAPRINAMGRLASGMDSLRLICTTKTDRAKELSNLLTRTNTERQKMVDTVLTEILGQTKNQSLQKVIIVANKSYHEGIIGLAAGKLVEEFYRPAIVLSIKGNMAKASARSISGFNIMEAINNSRDLISQGGGHTMAAGFSIETQKIEIFTKKINEYAENLLTDEILEKKLKVDCEIDFSQISQNLTSELEKLGPHGIGNPQPLFCSKNVVVVESKPVGAGGKHLKLKLKQKDVVFDAIWFNSPSDSSLLSSNPNISVAYGVEENVWNGYKNLQLKIKDVKIV